MSDKTAIEWSDATWNPTVGCSKVSPGCDHCYAETLVNRFAPSKGFPNRFDDMLLRGERFLTLPLSKKWSAPRRIFVNSLSDLFHKDVPNEHILRVFEVMEQAEQHTFQLLTKRPGRMRSFLRKHYPTPLPNVWGGTSVEDDYWAGVRIPLLLDAPLAVRWLSMEPLLGPVDLHAKDDGMYGHWLPDFGEQYDDGSCEPVCQAHGISRCRQRPGCTFIDWVVVGGESGRGARPMHPGWARSIRDQCVAAGVPFLFKQWGEWAPPWTTKILSQPAIHRFDDGTFVVRAGKGRAGRELDGRTWDEYPEATA